MIEHDPEIRAMSGLTELLDPLDKSVRRRVLVWASSRYLDGDPNREPGQQADQRSAYNEFVDLFDAADPTSAADAALVAAYWFQEVLGKPVLRAQELNTALKNLGHGLPNVTDALRTLEARKPAHVRQSGKDGRRQQARKTYKLTPEGAARVVLLIGGEEGERT